jgi:hypothetical protein
MPAHAPKPTSPQSGRASEYAADHSVPTDLMGHASPTTTEIYFDAVGIEEREFASHI